MASDPKLVARLETLLAGRPGVAPRKMFGGVCFMLNGNMCVGVHNDELIVRVGEKQAVSLLGHAHARPMDLTGKPMKGWLTIGRAGIVRRPDIERYVDAALSFVAELPPKSKLIAKTAATRRR
jgi:TfoX/Sxy family transcriptional regulator of competence genes